jgi:type VI secretion system protein ImpE
MTQARAMFEAGQLDEAIAELAREIKAQPTETGLRSFLFELLCFAGQWERAEKQLDVIAGQSARSEAGVRVYRNNIKAERARQALRTEGGEPHFLTEPPAYVDLLLDAVGCLRESRLKDASELLSRVEEQRPALAGTLDGRRFEDFKDYDDMTGPVLELIMHDKYAWLPFEQVRSIEITPPKNLRDLLWATARIETTDGLRAEVFLPVLYPGTSEHSDPQVKLGRVTDWRGEDERLYLAAGARLLLVDAEDIALLEMRSIEFEDVTADDSSTPA